MIPLENQINKSFQFHLYLWGGVYLQLENVRYFTEKICIFIQKCKFYGGASSVFFILGVCPCFF